MKATFKTFTRTVFLLIVGALLAAVLAIANPASAAAAPACDSNAALGSSNWCTVGYGRTNPRTAVGKVQTALRSHGYTGIVVDQRFGARTHNAIVSFQKSRGVNQDGLVGKGTGGLLAANTPATSIASTSTHLKNWSIKEVERSTARGDCYTKRFIAKFCPTIVKRDIVAQYVADSAAGASQTDRKATAGGLNLVSCRFDLDEVIRLSEIDGWELSDFIEVATLNPGKWNLGLNISTCIKASEKAWGDTFNNIHDAFRASACVVLWTKQVNLTNTVTSIDARVYDGPLCS